MGGGTSGTRTPSLKANLKRVGTQDSKLAATPSTKRAQNFTLILESKFVLWKGRSPKPHTPLSLHFLETGWSKKLNIDDSFQQKNSTGSKSSLERGLLPEVPPSIFSKTDGAQNSKLTALFNTKRAQNFASILGAKFVTLQTFVVQNVNFAALLSTKRAQNFDVNLKQKFEWGGEAGQRTCDTDELANCFPRCSKGGRPCATNGSYVRMG